MYWQRPITTRSRTTTVFLLMWWQVLALYIQVLAIYLARRDLNALAQVVTTCAFGLTFASAFWVLTQKQLARGIRNIAVACLGVTTALQWRLRDPLLFIQFDEQQHMRTLADIVSSHELFHPNPVLAISPRYPGLEALAALFHQLGLPVMGAATAVVLIARLVMVLTLCAAVEQLTGSARAGGLAAAMYSCTAQFVPWDSMFAYETLALPLALTAVALVARARRAENPRLLLIAASICLLAVVMTHHVTDVLTAVFFVIWTFTERGQARRRVLIATIVIVSSTALWMALQSAILHDYFAAWVDNLVSNARENGMRAPFSNAAAYTIPGWERAFIFYYAVCVALLAAVPTLACTRNMWMRWRRRPTTHGVIWQPRIFLVLPVMLIPLLMVTRAIPGFIEISNRLNTFLFLPLSLLVAEAGARWLRNHPNWFALRFRAPALVIATAIFMGGFLLGSGPGFVRIQGPYLPAAEGRSMDSETLAAVRWADHSLAEGSRIGADRVSMTLFASQAGLWPVLGKNDLAVAPLYFSNEFGPWQVRTAQAMHIRYLFVDRRLADGLPLVGMYFAKGETISPQVLTADQLSKFDDVNGITLRYRHGPISIYDLKDLGVDTGKSGWLGPAKHTNPLTQLGAGIAVALLLTFGRRYGADRYAIAKVQALRHSAGGWITVACGLAAVCVTSVVMLALGIWLSPYFFLSMALVCAALNRVLFVQSCARLRQAFRSLGIGWLGWLAVVGLLALPAAATISLAILDAAAVDVANVQQILNDRAAVHVPDD